MLERGFFSAQLHSKSAKLNWSVIMLSESLTLFFMITLAVRGTTCFQDTCSHECILTPL